MSQTVDIPGGTAELYDVTELTPRRKRPIKLMSTLHEALIRRVAAAATVRLPDGTVQENKELTGADLNLTEDELLILDRYQDASTWAFLKSWTLPQPLPETPDALLDLDEELYDALRLVTAKNGAEASNLAEQFEAPEDADGNQTVPFGNSAGSTASSPAVKKPSDRKPKSGSKSTGA